MHQTTFSKRLDSVEGSAPFGDRKHGPDVVEGLTPSETGKGTAHRAEAGNVETPAMWNNFAPTARERKKLQMKMMCLDLLNLITMPLGKSTLKKRAVVAVGEWSPRKKNKKTRGNIESEEKTPQARTLGKEGMVMHH
jgi:hypothetical protein